MKKHFSKNNLLKKNIILVSALILVLHSSTVFSAPVTVALKQGSKAVFEFGAKFGEDLAEKLAKTLPASVVIDISKEAEKAVKVTGIARKLVDEVSTDLNRLDLGTEARIQRNFELMIEAQIAKNKNGVEKYLDLIKEEMDFSRQLRNADGTPKEGVIIVRVPDCSASAQIKDGKTVLMGLEGASGTKAANYFNNQKSVNQRATSDLRKIGVPNASNIQDPVVRDAVELEQYLIASLLRGSDDESKAISALTNRMGGPKSLFDPSGRLDSKNGFLRVAYSDPAIAKTLLKEAGELKNLSGDAFRGALIDNIIKKAELSGIPKETLDVLRGCYR